MLRATVSATVGEWVQGWIGGRECLVSLVVDWRSSVILHEKGSCETLGDKALAALELAKLRFGRKELEGCGIDILNPYPTAKGFATSTMDIAGVISVCAAHSGEKLSDEELFTLCASIEASDGLMFGGLALVDHLRGELIERLPSPPDMEMVVLVPPAMLDTADYRTDERVVSKVRSMSKGSEDAYHGLKYGLSNRNASAVAEAATLSATLQQDIVPKAEWGVLLRAKMTFGALGIAAAHSGTASALLFDGGDTSTASDAAEWLEDELRQYRVGVVRAAVSGGGVRLSQS